MTMSNADLGCAVRRLRRARRVTIETLAFAAEMHPTYLSGIERGERNPSWEKITSLARALDVPVYQLAREAEDEGEVARAVREARARRLAESTQRTPRPKAITRRGRGTWKTQQAMSPVRSSHLSRPRSLAAGSRRGLHPARRLLRRGSDCRKSLLTPGSDRVESWSRGSENIFEQVLSGGTVTYMHHDQQGTTRLLTGSTAP